MLFIFVALTTNGRSCTIKYPLGGAVVQLGERLTGSQEVGSSSLLSSTILKPSFPRGRNASFLVLSFQS